MLTLIGHYLGCKVMPAKGDWPEARMVRLDTGEETYELRASGDALIAQVDGLKRFEAVTADVGLRLAKGESALYRMFLTGIAKTV